MDDQDLCYLDIAALGWRYRDRGLCPVETTQAVLTHPAAGQRAQ